APEFSGRFQATQVAGQDCGRRSCLRSGLRGQDALEPAQELLAIAGVERHWFAVSVDACALEPLDKFRGGPKSKYLADCEGVVETCGLIVEHDVVAARYAHEVIAASGGQQKHEIVSRVLIGDGVIRVADITSHWQPEQLAHEVIFQPRANDLTL